ncbi:DUF2291 family protein [Glycomyces xiaoerkulensis]|uniref:DUF2291 family protein n=1 Tax=Glycomyces xiaoerkulensis TaxID=2038139 RepID=UPI000C25FA0A|nr:DUF2291 family protein [Glycomyces xiaoerkulensis]
MSQQSSARRRRLRSVRRIVLPIGVAALLLGMAMDITVLTTDEAADAGEPDFDAEEYADEHFDAIVEQIIERAVPAEELAAAVAADVDAAGEEYGARADDTAAWTFPVAFEGTVGEADAVNGTAPVEVEGIPDGQEVIVQFGPIINGSALRDVTGEVHLGSFRNQMEYQSVATELNTHVRENVVADLDAAEIEAATVTVVGAFSRAPGGSWLVTPVLVEVN